MVKKLFSKKLPLNVVCSSIFFSLFTFSVYSPPPKKWKEFLNKIQLPLLKKKFETTFHKQNLSKEDEDILKVINNYQSHSMNFKKEEESLLELITHYYPRPDLLRTESLFSQDDLEKEDILETKEPFLPNIIKEEKSNLEILFLTDADIQKMIQQKTLPKIFVLQHIFLRFLDLLWKNEHLIDTLKRCMEDPVVRRAYAYGFNNSTKYTLELKKALKDTFTQEEMNFFLSEVFQKEGLYLFEKDFYNFLIDNGHKNNPYTRYCTNEQIAYYCTREYNVKEFISKSKVSSSKVDNKNFSHFVAPQHFVQFFQEKSKKDLKIIYSGSEDNIFKKKKRNEAFTYNERIKKQKSILYLIDAFFEDIFHPRCPYNYKVDKVVNSFYSNLVVAFISLIDNMSFNTYKSLNSHIDYHFKLKKDELSHEPHEKCSFLRQLKGYEVVNQVKDTFHILNVLCAFYREDNLKKSLIEQNPSRKTCKSIKSPALKKIFGSKVLVSFILEYTTSAAPYFFNSCKALEFLKGEDIYQAIDTIVINENFLSDFFYSFFTTQEDFSIFFKDHDFKVEEVNEFIYRERYHIFASFYKDEFLEGQETLVRKGFDNIEFKHDTFYKDKFIDKMLHEFKEEILPYVLKHSWNWDYKDDIFTFFSHKKGYGLPALLKKALVAYNLR